MDSIKNQSFKNFEVWIIDGGSAVETQDYLHKLEAPFFYQSNEDEGIYDAMNKGVDLSKGEWVYFLGAGDMLYTTAILNDVFNNLETQNTSLIAGKIIYEGDTKPFAYSKSKMIKNVHWSNRIWLTNGLHHQGTFYKKELFADNSYNVKYKTLADYYFNLQLFKNNTECKIIDKIIAKCDSNGISKKGNWKMYLEEVNLKSDLSLMIFKPFFYIIAFTKFLSRKVVND
jgi:putative colanic acid biosynthesis glycosyltransferase